MLLLRLQRGEHRRRQPLCGVRPFSRVETVLLHPLVRGAAELSAVGSCAPQRTELCSVRGLGGEAATVDCIWDYIEALQGLDARHRAAQSAPWCACSRQHTVPTWPPSGTMSAFEAICQCAGANSQLNVVELLPIQGRHWEQ